MKKYKNILFDLDGTLIDPKEGITNSIKYALSHFGINVTKTEELYKFIGPPLRESFSKYYKFNEEETENAVKKYREYFREKGIYENYMYNGIPEMLEKLVLDNRKVILATSKPEIFTKKILERLGIIKYFNCICGATLDNSRSKKGQIIKYILDNQNLDLSNTVMIGDRSHDIIGAKENNLDSIGVLYGYGTYDELQESGANYIVKDIKELELKLL